MTEEWKPIPSWPGYEASSEGRIRRTVMAANNRPPSIIEGCYFNSGYRCVQFGVNRKKFTLPVHRLVCEAFHGPAPEGKNQVRHLDGTRDNNRPENLMWGTAKENARDRRLHGRDRRGSDHHSAKIDDHDVLAMFCLRRRGLTGEEIAAVFGMDRNQVNKILARTSWQHIDVPSALLSATSTYCRGVRRELHLFGEVAR